MLNENKNNIIIYTDGGCHGNPGPGAWACYIQVGLRYLTLSDSKIETTNNRMELSAAIGALNAVIKSSNWNTKHIILYTDSMYLINGITKWIVNWKKLGWIKGHHDIKNIDLWKQLDLLNSKLDIEWKWVKGHNGNRYNEFCDWLCQEKIAKIEKVGF